MLGDTVTSISQTVKQKISVEITNRDIKEATGFSLRQTQRYATAFLKSDPSAGQHSGRRRHYSFNQAVKLRIGGHLIVKHRFTTREAQQILSDIFLWLEEKNWLPAAYFDFKPLRNTPGYFINWENVNYPDLEIHVGVYNRQFGYTVKEFLDRREDPDPEIARGEIFTEVYRSHRFGDSRPFFRDEGKIIYFADMVTGLARLLSGASRRV